MDYENIEVSKKKTTTAILSIHAIFKRQTNKAKQKMRLDWSDSSVVHPIPKKTLKSDPGKVTLTICFLDLFMLKYKHFTNYVEFICSTLNNLPSRDEFGIILK